MRKNKIKVEAFFPFSSCACTYAPFMERIGRVKSKFRDSVEFQMKSTRSKEAREYGVHGTCVIVDGAIRLPADFSENDLEKAIIKRAVG